MTKDLEEKAKKVSRYIVKLSKGMSTKECGIFGDIIATKILLANLMICKDPEAYMKDFSDFILKMHMEDDLN